MPARAKTGKPVPSRVPAGSDRQPVMGYFSLFLRVVSFDACGGIAINTDLLKERMNLTWDSYGMVGDECDGCCLASKHKSKRSLEEPTYFGISCSGRYREHSISHSGITYTPKKRYLISYCLVIVVILDLWIGPLIGGL
ncbi:hypothetical protein C5167_004684 [Papaver somniferum]|uniref:Uncharacterized protein n=1 Tax=Papaver somniferum TaxID=3469 RepID=A0A4Y7J8B4_PAPSO|nr:hypothetical protein C5167_004684 [Papaver somniferum]